MEFQVQSDKFVILEKSENMKSTQITSLQAADKNSLCASSLMMYALYNSVSTNLSYSASEIYASLQEAEELANMILANNTVQTQLPAIADENSIRKKQNIESSVYNTLTNYLFNTPNRSISYISI